MGNILEDRIDEFYEVALVASKKLSKKYYTVSNYMSSEDIVQDVAINIIRWNIEFDDSKGNFKNFIYMLVSNSYVDNARKIKKHTNCVSLEVQTSDDAITFEEIVDTGYRVDNAIISSENVREILEGLPCESSRVGETPLGVMNMSIKNLIQLKIQGYNAKEMGEWFGVKQANINLQLRKGKRILKELL